MKRSYFIFISSLFLLASVAVVAIRVFSWATTENAPTESADPTQTQMSPGTENPDRQNEPKDATAPP